MKKQIAVLIIFMFAALGNICAQSPTLPALPQKTVSLIFPTQGSSPCPTLTTGSNCIRSVPAGDAASFQKAINAAACGDTIVLVAGSTYSGNFVIPTTSCSGWVVVETNSVDRLPLPGNRVGPTNLSAMATVSAPNTDRAIRFLPKANHWRFIGLEITASYVSTTYSVSNIVSAGLQSDNSSLIKVQSELPAYVIFDRIYLHGLPNSNSKHGIQMDAQYLAVVDSYCDEIHDNGNDAQCFYSTNGSGPFLIQNNFIQASSENILFGGGDPAIPNLIPSDITIVGNVIQKNQAWRGQPAPYNWQVKNLLEFKNAQRVLIDGNVIQYNWEAEQSGQAVKLTPRNQYGRCTWCAVQDFTITHNIIRHASIGVQISEGDSPSSGSGYSMPSARILIQNNLLDDINSMSWGSGNNGWGFFLQSAATSTHQAHDIVIDHNTVLSDQMAINFGDTSALVSQSAAYINNIFNYGLYGVKGTGASSGSVTLNTFSPGSNWNDSVLINSAGITDGNTWPSGTRWSTQANVKFTDFAVSNYQLTNDSPYRNAGTNGKDIGVWDWTCLNNDIAAALAGKFVPGPGCALNSLNSITPPQPPANVSAVID